MWLPLGGFLLLLLLSGRYWLERAAMVDAAFQLWSIVAQQDWAIQVQRFAAVLVQAPALLLTRLGADLPLILQAYSLSFVLYPLLFFVLLWRVIRHEKAALALFLYFFLLTVHTFFWVQSELIQAGAWAILTAAAADRFRRPGIPLLLLLWGGVVTTIYAHPLALIPFLYIWAWLLPEGERSPAYLSQAGVALVVVLLKTLVWPTGGYDSTAMEMITGFEERIGAFFSLDGTRQFGRHLLDTYYLYLPLCAAAIIVLLRDRAWWRLLLFALFTCGWLALVLTTWWYGAEPFYIESYYLIAGLFLALPLAWHLLSRLPQVAQAGLLAVIILLRVGQVIQTGEAVYRPRAEWLTEQVDRMQQRPGQKYLLQRQQAPMELLRMDWAVPYETMLVSALAGPDSVRTLLIYEGEGPPESARQARAIATPWGIWPYDWFMGVDYFFFRDTLPARPLTE